MSDERPDDGIGVESGGQAAGEGEGRRCGFVAIVGAPNAGKSTLLNLAVGSKISIVSAKVQTTRTRILGIRVDELSQVVFVDTPGIFAPRRRLDRAMVRTAWREAVDADLIVLLVDAAKGVDDDVRRIVDGLKEAGRRAVLALNKIDTIRRDRLLELADRLFAEGVFTDVFMISALGGDGVPDLMRHLAAAVPLGPWLFPEDQLTDIPMRMLAAEITREKVFIQLHDELPYSTTVETENWEEFRNGDVRIEQVVYVQRTSQRAIVLGKGGQRIRRIGAAAREELEALLERRVHLFLFVKVRENWADDPERFREIGLDFEP